MTNPIAAAEESAVFVRFRRFFCFYGLRNSALSNPAALLGNPSLAPPPTRPQPDLQPAIQLATRPTVQRERGRPQRYTIGHKILRLGYKFRPFENKVRPRDKMT